MPFHGFEKCKLYWDSHPSCKEPKDHLAGQYDFLKSFGIDSTLKMIGADSTNLNTGHKEGSTALLEKQLGKRLV